MFTTTFRRHLRDLHGSDVEVRLIGRADGRRGAAYSVQRPTFKSIINAVATSIVAIPVFGVLLLLFVLGLGFLSLLVYVAMEALGCQDWIAWTVVAIVDLFTLVLAWVNRN